MVLTRPFHPVGTCHRATYTGPGSALFRCDYHYLLSMAKGVYCLIVKGGLRLPADSRSYIAFLLCCRLAPPPGRGSLRGALFPPPGFAFGAPVLALWVSLWGSWGRVGAPFGAPLVPPLAPPWGSGSAPVYLDLIEIASSLLCLAQAILWRVFPAKRS